MKLTPLIEINRGRSGFTLVELIVGTGISGVLMAVCLTSFIALQKFQAVCLARSGLRTEMIRMFDTMEVDLRSAKSVTAGVSGSENVFPLVVTVPQRYTAYATTNAMAGEPGRSASRIVPTVSNGKLTVPNDITVSYDSVANGTTAQDIRRTVNWTESGVAKTATRVIATVPSAATIRFRSSNSTSASPSPITSADIAIVAKVDSPLSSKRIATATPTTMETTIFLRRKALK